MAASCSQISKPSAYKPRHPEKAPFFSVLYHYYEKFKAVYEERFQKEFGRWRGVTDKVVGKYFQCGIFLGGFARLRCENCGAEKLLALSCKTRGFCPSCGVKRALLWAEFVQEKVLKSAPHRHAVFTLPKMLRPYFKFHRDLLPALCSCAWSALRDFFKDSLTPGAMPGAILTINTAGQFLAFNPHIHGIVTCGGFLANGDFEAAPAIDMKTVRELFEAKVFSLLREKGLISHELVDKIRSWKHTGFDAWIGPPISDMKEIVQIGMYTVRSPASSGRLVLGDGPQLKYYAKGTQPDRDIGSLFEPESRTFDYLDWIARLTSHIPDKGCQLVHYFGKYSNAHRGKEAHGGSKPHPDTSPGSTITEPEEDWIKARRKSWARMIQQVYETNPLLCECGSKFKVISVIEARHQSNVVGKILASIKFVFEVLQLSECPPPVISPEPDGGDDTGSDAYCF